MTQSNQELKKNIVSFANENRSLYERMLHQLVETPTVSADSGREADFQRAAQLASEYLVTLGAKAKVYPTAGNPIVVGEFRTPGAQHTITIYNHLDVQPAQEPEWRRDPFVFLQQDGRYHGRGATDDKGPALTVLFAAAFAHRAGIPINIRFLWEMEEEIGSPNFEPFLKANRAHLKTDSVLVVDSIWISPKKPTIYYGLRGNIKGSMTLETANGDVHSGIVGGVARNPMTELMEVISRIQDAKTGKVKIPGFYKRVRKVTSEELQRFQQIGFQLERWAKSYGLKQIRLHDPIQAMVNAWCLPTFEVHGMVGGYTGPGVKTAIPPRAELKFSARLVPDQDGEEVAALITSFVRKCNPDVRVKIGAVLKSFVGPVKGPNTEAAVDAVRFGFNKKPVFARSGGSDGAIALMDKHLAAPITLLGLSLPLHGYHAPNEYFEWTQALGGMKMFVRYFMNVCQKR